MPLPPETPRTDCYPAPVDYAAELLHYCVVQVSKRKYVVAMYSGRARSMKQGASPHAEFAVVTEPMKYLSAVEKCYDLTEERLANQRELRKGK